MVFTVTEDLAVVVSTSESLRTAIFGTISELVTLVMGNALLLIPIAILLVYTGIKVFKWIFC